jgi:hypothetical protein
MSSALTLHNLFHQTATVELRTGEFDDCNLNSPLPAISIPAGGEHKLMTDEPICFRRDLDPDNPTGQMTEWTRVNFDPPPASPQCIDENI